MDKQKFELSLWESYIPDGKDYFTERKKFILASDTLESRDSAYNVTLKENINGERTLDFTIHYRYFDESGNEIENPFFAYLNNEARIKLRDGEDYTIDPDEDPAKIMKSLASEDTEEKWTDFIIKSVNKDSDRNTAQVSCKEIFVNELGKNGWSITLDTELENNTGTVIELGEKILDGSDWSVDEDSYSPTERAEDPLMVTTTKTQLTAWNILDLTKQVTIPANSTIYLFYSQCELDSENKWALKSDLEEIQIMYAKRPFVFSDLDDNYIIIDDDSEYNYTVAALRGRINDITATGENGDLHLTGRRVVKQQKTVYKNAVDKYCKVWNVLTQPETDVTLSTVYSYTETNYSKVNYVKNYLTNTSNFTSQSAWQKKYTSSGAEVSSKPVLQSFPMPTTAAQAAAYSSSTEKELYNYLKLDFNTDTNTYYINQGPKTNALAVVKEDQYVVRLRARWLKNGLTDYGTGDFLTENLPSITFQLTDKNNADYGSITLSQTTSSKTLPIYTTPNRLKGYPQESATRTINPDIGTTYVDEQGYYYGKFSIIKSSDVEDDQLLLKITSAGVTNYSLCIEDIQLFVYQTGDIIDKEDASKTIEGTIVFPDDATTSVVDNTEVFFYTTDDEPDEPIYISNLQAHYQKVYESNYAAVRNISVKESNYFNNIQTLAELFEVWPKFTITHQKNGAILIKDGVPQKKVKFQRYSPNGKVINQTGFKKGINTKKITRKVDSNEIATKVIVVNNEQEYATDGVCSITRASSNPTGENEIYNFNYYISNGLINSTTLSNDLYNDYFPFLKTRNTRYDEISKYITNYTLTNLENDAKKTTYTAAIDTLKDENETLMSDLTYLNENDNLYKSKLATYSQNISSIYSYQLLLDQVTANYDELKLKIKALESEQSDINDAKKLKKLLFYKKYSQFILEGTWNDNSYIDDNLYYYDGCKVAEVSSYPKVTYDLQVMDINSIEGYELYTFKVGERSYIEDVDFFGYENYTFGNEVIKTPKKIEVIISERSRNFSDPSKSSISVKNYKNQFEELFQKINATSQQLQYASGSYERAASAVLSNGTVDSSILQNTLTTNNITLQNSVDGSVQWDENGIVAVNPTNSVERLKIQNGSLMASSDGGATWSTGIDGTGINTTLLKAGQIDVDKLNLMSGEEPCFRWDKEGIRAYRKDAEYSTYNPNKYVNYNQYGIYGTTDAATLEEELEEAETFDEKIEAINDNANFALGWDGLHLNSKVSSETLNNYRLKIKPDGLFFVNGSQNVFSLDKNGLKISTGVIEEDVENKAYTEFNNGKVGEWYIDQEGMHFPISKETEEITPSYNKFFVPVGQPLTITDKTVTPNEVHSYNNICFRIQNLLIDDLGKIYNGQLYDTNQTRSRCDYLNNIYESSNILEIQDENYGRVGSIFNNIPKIFAYNIYGPSNETFVEGLMDTDLETSIQTIGQLQAQSNNFTCNIQVDESQFISQFPTAKTKVGDTYPQYSFVYSSETEDWIYNSTNYTLQNLGIILSNNIIFADNDTITVQNFDLEMINYTKLIELIADKVKTTTTST